MSLSNQSKSTTPAKRFLRVKSGNVNYYDKEEGKNLEVQVPFSFVVLDQLATVKGWSDADQSGFWANEVRKAGSDELVVRTKTGTKAQGVWKDIKNEAALAGAKFNTSVYIATNGAEGLEINNIAFSGASLNAWIEFVNANKGVTRGTHKVEITGFKDEKKGAVKYQTPIFAAVDVSGAELTEATKLDVELQDYLDGYFSNRNTEELVATAQDTVAEVGDDPIDLNDIPF